jgi:hypothetical protein
VYITTEEKRPEVIGLAQTPSTVLVVMNRAVVDKQEKERQQRTNVVDSNQ